MSEGSGSVRSSCHMLSPPLSLAVHTAEEFEQSIKALSSAAESHVVFVWLEMMEPLPDVQSSAACSHH